MSAFTKFDPWAEIAKPDGGAAKVAKPAKVQPTTSNFSNFSDFSRGAEADEKESALAASDGAPTREAPERGDFQEDRAAIIEHDANLPREWADGFARLCTIPRPAAVTPERWTQVINDAGKFCDRWAAKAAALGWQTLDVFGCHHAKPDARLDAAGLVWLICGNEVVAIGPDAVILRTHSGASHTIRPRTVAAEGALRVAAWELEAGAT